MMISRMIISLKKGASSQRTHMSVEVPNGLQTNLEDTYFHHPAEQPLTFRAQELRSLTTSMLVPSA